MSTAAIHFKLFSLASRPFAPASLTVKLHSRDTSVHQFVYLARDIWERRRCGQRRHTRTSPCSILASHLPPGVAGRDACNSGDINAGVDVALRDTGREQVAALGQGFMPGGQVPDP